MSPPGDRERADAHDPDGLDASPTFRRYMARLRRLWPQDPDLEDEYGVPAGNGRSYEPMSKSQSGESDVSNTNTTHGRRAFMVATGATLTGAGLAGLASAQQTLDYDADVVPNPGIVATTTKDTHEPEFSPYAYLDDNMNETELPARLDTRDGDDVYHVRADRVDADDYRGFPRDLEVENDDGDDEAVSAIDAEHWTSDTITVADGDLEVDSVRIEGTGVATFDGAGELAVEFDPRNYVQVGVNVDAISADSLVEIRATDGTNSISVSIDPDGDESADEIVATATGGGVLHQVQATDLAGSEELGEITAVEVEITGADAELELWALNIERASEWEYGETVVEGDDGDETETVRSPSGEFTLTSLDTGLVDGSTIYELGVDVVYDAANAGLESEHTIEETDRYPPYDALSTTVSRVEVPTAYELEHSGLELVLDQEMPTSRYSIVEVGDDTEETDVEDIEWSSATNTLAGEGERATLEDMVLSGTEYAVRTELKLTDSETGGIEATGGAGGARSSGGGGIWNWIMTGVLSFAGFFGIRRLAGSEEAGA